MSPHTRVFQIDPASPDPGLIAAACETLRRGGLAAFPTETVYGLGANALDPAAVGRIFEAKGRPPTNPIIVHVADAAGARTLVRDWPPSAERLATAFWPGPLTLVLPKTDLVPSIVASGGPTVGVRVPNHPVALALLRACGFPLAAPSANRSEHVSPTSAEHVRADLAGRIDLILDAGPTARGLESTVVDLADGPRILRPGPISQSQLEEVLGQACPLAGKRREVDGPLRSPGLLDRHYAPRTPMECRAAAGERVREAAGSGERAAWLALAGEETAHAPPSATVVVMPNEPEAYGRRLYAELRRLDGLQLDRIVATLPPEEESWAAVRDRLMRGSAR